MNKFTFVTVTALALALAAGSAQAAGKMGGASGMDRAGDGRNGVQLNGIPMPDGLVLADRKPGVASGSGAIAATSDAPSATPTVHGRVLAAGKMGGAGGMDIPMVETVELPDWLVLAGGRGGVGPG